MSQPVPLDESSKIPASIFEVHKKTSKRWCQVAIGVGILVVIGVGGFGSIGLLHSYAIIHAPSCLVPAIEIAGATPHFWSLWVIAVGSVVTGSGCIGGGLYGCLDSSSPKVSDSAEIETGPTIPNLPEHTPVNWSLCDSANDPNSAFSVWSNYLGALEKHEHEIIARTENYDLQGLKEENKQLTQDQSIHIWKRLIPIYSESPTKATLMTEMLLPMMSDVNAQDEEGNTLLHDLGKHALLTNDIVLLFKDNHPNSFNTCNARHETPLHLAFKNPNNNSALNELAQLASQDQLMQKDQKGLTPLYYALKRCIFSTQDNMDASLEALKIMVAKEAIVAEAQQSRELLGSILGHADIATCEKLLKTLGPALKSGINTPSSKGITPFKQQEERFSKDPQIRDLLLKLGALPTRDLHAAIAYGQEYTLQLINNTPHESLNQKDASDKTFIQNIFLLALHDKKKSSPAMWSSCFKALVEKGIRLTDEKNIAHDMMNFFLKNGYKKFETHDNFAELIDSILPLLHPNDVVAVTDQRPNPPIHRLLMLKLAYSDTGEKVLRSLIQKMDKASVNITGDHGLTVLHLTWHCKPKFANEIIAELCNKGADITLQDDQGNTPLHNFFKKSIFSKRCETRLNKSYHITDNQGNTPLHLFAKRQFNENDLRNSDDLEFPSICTKEYAFNAFSMIDANGNTPLHIGADWPTFLRKARLLLGSEAWQKLNLIKNKEGKTFSELKQAPPKEPPFKKVMAEQQKIPAQPLQENKIQFGDPHAAITLGASRTLGIILAAPTENLRMVDSSGKTFMEKIFLHALSETNDSSIAVNWSSCFTELVKKGVRLAEDEGNILHAMIDLFRENKAILSQTVAYELLLDNFMRMIREIILLLKPDDLNVSEKHPNATPLHQLLALHCGESLNGVITILALIKKMDPSIINIQNKNGRSLLHLGIYCNKKDITSRYFIMRDLCDKGAIVTLQDQDGNTPLHLFYQKSIFDSRIEKLLNKCYIIQNKHGETPLHLFAKRNLQDIHPWRGDEIQFPNFVEPEIAIESFLIQDSAGNNPLHIALQNNYLQFLISAETFLSPLPQVWEKLVLQKNLKGQNLISSFNVTASLINDLEEKEKKKAALATLGLPQNATSEQIKDKYKKLSRELHPDKNPQGAEQFKAVSVAYEYLTKNT